MYVFPTSFVPLDVVRSIVGWVTVGFFSFARIVLRTSSRFLPFEEIWLEPVYPTVRTPMFDVYVRSSLKYTFSAS